jgi:hypothetical protein
MTLNAVPDGSQELGSNQEMSMKARFSKEAWLAIGPDPNVSPPTIWLRIDNEVLKSVEDAPELLGRIGFDKNPDTKHQVGSVQPVSPTVPPQRAMATILKSGSLDELIAFARTELFSEALEGRALDSTLCPWRLAYERGVHEKDPRFYRVLLAWDIASTAGLDLSKGIPASAFDAARLLFTDSDMGEAEQQGNKRKSRYRPFAFHSHRDGENGVTRISFEFADRYYWGRSKYVTDSAEHSLPDEGHLVRMKGDGMQAFCELSSLSYYDDERTHSNGRGYLWLAKNDSKTAIDKLFASRHSIASLKEAATLVSSEKARNSSSKRGFDQDPLVKLIEAGIDEECLILRPYNQTILHHLARNKLERALEAWHRARGSVDARDDTGMTPLMDLCSSSGPRDYDVKIVRRLIDLGAGIDLVDEQGNSPLHLAAESNRADIVRLLIDSGAKLDARNKNGFTPGEIARATRANESIAIFNSIDARRAVESVMRKVEAEQGGDEPTGDEADELIAAEAVRVDRMPRTKF